MLHPGRIARLAVMAGLGVSMTLGPATPALAQKGTSNTPVVGEYANPDYKDQVTGTSKGDTKLYIIGEQDDLTTSEGAVNEQMKVSIPVAIHYVADSEGNLTGPSDDTVKFVNHTKMGAVHVSAIAVQNASNAHIVPDASVGTQNDYMSFFMTPYQGQSNDAGSTFTRGTATEGNDTAFVKEGTQDELGYYTSNGATSASASINPKNKNEWNIAQKNGALALNGLTGKIGGFKNLDPSTDQQAGTIHWTVRAGTRAQADTKDATVTIHFNSNNGSNKDCVPVGDQKVVVLDTSVLPTKTALASGMSTAITAGSGVEAPKQVTNADGTVTTYTFSGWKLNADGSGDVVSTVQGLGTAEQIAGKTFELYATFTSTTS